MRILLIVLDSVRYDIFLEADTPNFDSLGRAVEAYSHGTWTRPSMASMLSGYLPTSELGQPFKPSWVMLSREVFHERELEAYFLNSNAWAHRLAPRAYRELWYPEPFSADLMVEDALKILRNRDECFVAMLFTETHGPYNYRPEVEYRELVEATKAFNRGVDNGAPKMARMASMKAIEYIDWVAKPLLDQADFIIVTSDHGELMGDDGIHKIGHDPSMPFHPALVRVPLIMWGEEEWRRSLKTG